MKRPMKLTEKQRARNARHSAKFKRETAEQKKPKIITAAEMDAADPITVMREKGGASMHEISEEWMRMIKKFEDLKPLNPPAEKILQMVEDDIVDVVYPEFPIQPSPLGFVIWNECVRVFPHSNPGLTVTWLRPDDAAFGRDDAPALADCKWYVFMAANADRRCKNKVSEFVHAVEVECDGMVEAMKFCVRFFPSLYETAMMVNEVTNLPGYKNG